MQTSGAYVDQIPAGSRGAASDPGPLKIAPNPGQAVQRPPPPGLYVQVANVPDQAQAIEAGLSLAQRLGSGRPAFIRGQAALVQGQPRLLMYAGPFADDAAARRFCAQAVPQQACVTRVFTEPPPQRTAPQAAQTAGPTRVGP